MFKVKWCNSTSVMTTGSPSNKHRLIKHKLSSRSLHSHQHETRFCSDSQTTFRTFSNILTKNKFVCSLKSWFVARTRTSKIAKNTTYQIQLIVQHIWLLHTFRSIVGQNILSTKKDLCTWATMWDMNIHTLQMSRSSKYEYPSPSLSIRAFQ